MRENIIRTFLEDDAKQGAAAVLLGAIGEHQTKGGPNIEKYVFNRFIVTVDYSAGTVLLEDDLTPGEDGDVHLGIQEFRERLVALG